LLIDCPDRRGLISRVSTMLYEHGANILHADQHQDHELGLFFMRVEWALNGANNDSSAPAAGSKHFDLKAFHAEFAPLARELGFGVIYTIAPSPLRAGMVWAGSDTGLIHLTRDGGKTWTNVTPPGFAAWSKVTQIEASHFEPGTAWAAVDRHRREDYQPYVYRTHDFGKTWTLAADGLAAPAYLNSIKEDPARQGLLYACTELGVAVSFDDAAHWQPLQLNLPAVSVRDLVVHGDDLAIATHGRGFWILDNVTPLRQVDERTASTNVVLYRPAAAVRMNPESFFGTPFPPEEPQARNPPDGAIVDFYLKAAPAGDVTLEILDAKGEVVRTWSSRPRPETPRRPGAVADIWIAPPSRLTARPGMNRFAWDLRYGAPGEESAVAGPQVLPGTYTVRLSANGHSATQPLKVTLDPRSTAIPAEIQQRFNLSIAIWRDMNRAAEASREGAALRRALAGLRQSASPGIAAKLDALVKEIESQNISFKTWATPGDTRNSAELDVARTVCRRAERRVCDLQSAGAPLNFEIII